MLDRLMGGCLAPAITDFHANTTAASETLAL